MFTFTHYYAVQYWDSEEQCWRFRNVSKDELERLLENPRYEVRHYYEVQDEYPY